MAALTRVLGALPVLLVTPFILRALTFAEPAVGNLMNTLRATPSFELGEQSFRLLDSLFGLPVVDDIFAGITAAFSLVHIFPEEHGAYWQALVFLTEYAGVYAVLLLEGSRGVNKGRLFGYPFLLSMIGQMIPIGLVAPLWLFFYLALTPKTRFQVPGSMGIDAANAAAVLPTVVLAYFIPHFAAFLHQDLNARHWWMWIWQLYPIWGSLIFFALSQVLAPIVSGMPSRKIVQVTLVALSTVNVGVKWYTDVNSDFTAYNTFVPKFLLEKPEDPIVAMMTILQYDHICTFAGVLIWLLRSLSEVESSEKGRMMIVLVFLGLLSMFGVLSVGTVTLIAWEVRERMMVADLEAVILRAANEKKK